MGGWYINGTELEMKAVSQEDYDQFMELYNAIDRVYTYDTEIYDIVNKMAEPLLQRRLHRGGDRQSDPEPRGPVRQ